MRKKVVIGLSGGIDSSMAAFMLKKQGFEVIGLHFSFINQESNEQLDKISEQLRIPLVKMDIRNDFEMVKTHFASEYLKGRTPSPCTFCNKLIKWQKLVDFADENNCEYISSGHYIRKTEYNGYHFLRKGIDPVKDQSYFMWELGSNTIKRMINPLGEYTKNDIRQLANENGFSDLVRKKESMGVCFLQNTDYRNFLRSYVPDKIEAIQQGIVKDESNKKVGTHQGYINYTIGQKRGLNLDENRPAFVSHIDPVSNELIIGTKKSLYHYHILLENIHLINPKSISINSKVMINIRGLGLNPEEPAMVKNMNLNSIELELSNPAWAVAPGQPVVFYQDDLVLGGGIAEKSW